MAITAETRTQLIGLSVAMLGQAPGTDRLNHWVADIDDDAMSVDDLANHIAESEAFQSEYPAFLTSMEFAEAFLGSVLYGLDDASMMAAVELVSGMLDGGLSRGSLALAVVDALHDIAMQGMDHPAYDGLGMSAMVMYNKVHVASHYTLDARMEEPSSDVLANVTADADSAAMAIEAIDNPPAPPMEEEVVGLTFSLTTTFDEFPGADMNNSGDDTIFAQPVQQVSAVHQDTLNPEDDIDGGDGNDSIYIWKFDTDETLLLGAENIRNVENAILNTVGAIDADLTSWDGLESVVIDRVGREADHSVKVFVDDGATVSSSSKVKSIAGDVTIVGASGDVSLVVGEMSEVHIGSDMYTETVMVEGGKSVTVDNGSAGSEKQSETVTSVSVAGTLRAEGEDTDEVMAYRILTDLDLYVVGANGTTRVELTGGTVTIEGTPTEVDGVEIRVDDGKIVDSDGNVILDDEGDPLTFNDQGRIVKATDDGGTPAGVTNNISAGREAASFVSEGANSPTVKVLSNSIESIMLTNSDAVVLVTNDSKDEDKKGTPEDLMVTVDGYGGLPGADDGKICLNGAGTSENIMINVAGDSAFSVASNTVKTVAISGEGDLELEVTKFSKNDDGGHDPAGSLESITVASAGDVAIGLTGLSGLTMVDASGSGGAVELTMDRGADPLGKLTMVTTGSGGDTVTLNTNKDSALESIDTGEGGDKVTIRGAHPKDGIEVNLGDGNDTFTGSAGNVDSRIDAGEGMDTLNLTSIANSTYKGDDDKQKSIYTGFETLDVSSSEGGVYDIKLLGIVNDVRVSNDTMDEVTLANMADGMGISVSGLTGIFRGGRVIRLANRTDAEIVHQLADREAGQPRSSGELDVSLTANGFANNYGQVGTPADIVLGEAVLTLTTGEEIEVVKVTSNARPSTHPDFAGSAATRMLASDYVNEITLKSAAGEDAALEEIIVDGNAQLNIMGSSDAFGELKLVDATGNTGGVTFNGDGLGQLEILGGDGNDNLMSGSVAADDSSRTATEIYGGLGGDVLTGGDGRDHFIIDDASESQARTDGSGDIIHSARFAGHDTIINFNVEVDKIDLSRSLLGALKGDIKDTTILEDGRSDWDDWMKVDHDEDDGDSQNGTADRATTYIDGNDDKLDADADATGAKDLDTFIGNGDGLFESRDTAPDGQQTDVGSNTVTNNYSVAVVKQDVAEDHATLKDGLWLLFDVDGDGDFDADTDMVIFLQGDDEASTIDANNIFI